MVLKHLIGLATNSADANPNRPWGQQMFCHKMDPQDDPQLTRDIMFACTTFGDAVNTWAKRTSKSDIGQEQLTQCYTRPHGLTKSLDDPLDEISEEWSSQGPCQCQRP